MTTEISDKQKKHKLFKVSTIRVAKIGEKNIGRFFAVIFKK